MLIIKFISLFWAICMSLYFIVAKYEGVSIFVAIFMKVLSAISLGYFITEIIKLFP